ncbi:MAG: ferrous iron transport protein B [Anaerolineae bacterium]
MSCHAEAALPLSALDPLIILAGHPNVGKSVLFKRLTGRYVTVSNYPGTTVEVSQGQAVLDGRRTLVVDAPGINSLTSLSDDERVTRDLLLQRRPDAVVQVGDAKNLARALFLTLQFAEMDAPLVLDLNMTDEARRQGIHIDYDRLGERLGIPVVPTIATRGEGVGDLVASLPHATIPHLRVTYAPTIEAGLAAIESVLPGDLPGRRGRAVMLLAGESDAALGLALDAEALAVVEGAREAAKAHFGRPLSHVITQERWQAVTDIVADVCLREDTAHASWRQRLDAWTVHPVLGWPIVLLIVYLVFKFVGEFGAVTMVNWVQGTVFGQWISPAVTSFLETYVPIPLLQDFLVGEYGLVTVGLAYGFGIVLPIVATFFLAFGVLEDSGYLPRLAVMVNRAFRVIGLNGKAVLPMVLGLGCVTMATMTTRILGTRKERLLATLLLALSIPCSAQLGVILALVSWLTPGAVAIWAAVMLGVLLLVGWLASRLIPGSRSDLILELPPLRLPQPDNLLLKTVMRVEWYLKEVVPLFLLATAFLWVLARTGVLAAIETLMSPLVVGWLGLPPQTASIFLLGFLRRDYGAVGLFEMVRGGTMTSEQVLVSLVVITLFVPCVATVLMMIKEHGWRVGLAIVAFVFPFAFLVGGIVHRIVGG